MDEPWRNVLKEVRHKNFMTIFLWNTQKKHIHREIKQVNDLREVEKKEYKDFLISFLSHDRKHSVQVTCYACLRTWVQILAPELHIGKYKHETKWYTDDDSSWKEHRLEEYAEKSQWYSRIRKLGLGTVGNWWLLGKRKSVFLQGCYPLRSYPWSSR